MHNNIVPFWSVPYRLGLNVFIIHIIMSWRFPRSRVLFTGADNFSICLHLLVKGGQGRSDKLFNEHADQDTFGRPIGISTVDLMRMLYQSLLLVSLIFFGHALLYW